MNKVYIVTMGEYSDYSIVGVYSTREKAEAVVRTYKEWDDWYSIRVEEYVLDSVQIYGRVCVQISKDGEIACVWTGAEIGIDDFEPVWYDSNGDLIVCCLNVDKDKAVKKATDIRTAILNEGIWGNNKLTKEFLRRGIYD